MERKQGSEAVVMCLGPWNGLFALPVRPSRTKGASILGYSHFVPFLLLGLLINVLLDYVGFEIENRPSNIYDD